MSYSSPIESLESRTLLAGVTILTHGLAGNITGWIASAADAIIARIGGSAPSYILKIGDTGNRHLGVLSFTKESGPTLTDSANAEAIVKLDWTDVDGGAFSTDEVGRVATDFMLSHSANLPVPIASLPIHLIGHSRGASLATAIAQHLGEHGIWVDQVTSLDPHPVDGVDDFLGLDFDDTKMRSWSNITFADDYWRTDGDTQNFDFDGEPVAGAHQGDLNNSVQQDFVGSAHLAVTAYYHGTIDLHAHENNDHPVLDSWYGTSTSKPARNATGYAFSRLGGTSRPLDGLSPLFGGTAAREDIGEVGSQWSNADYVTALDSQTTIGNGIRLRFRRQDRDGGSTVTLFLDRDRNPFNENNARKVGQRDYAQADELVVERIDGHSSDVSPGNYYVYAKTVDPGGHVRYAYSRRIKLVAPAARVSALHFSSTSTISALAGTRDDATVPGFDPTTA